MNKYVVLKIELGNVKHAGTFIIPATGIQNEGINLVTKEKHKFKNIGAVGKISKHRAQGF